MKQYPLKIEATVTTSGDPHRYYSKGHHGGIAFVDALLSDMDDVVEEDLDQVVTHGWWSWVPDSTGALGKLVVDRSGPGPGAFPVTWVEVP